MQLLARKAMSSANSKSVTSVYRFRTLLAVPNQISIKPVGHPDASPLLTVLLQRHTYGNIKIKVEESGCQQTALTNAVGDKELTRELPVCPNSSSRVFMQGTHDGQQLWGQVVRMLKDTPEGFAVD